jgi:hypothetical protein
MDAGSSRVRALWRAVAVVFAVSVVTVRLGVAGCGPLFFGPTKAGGGFNGAQQATVPQAEAGEAAPAPNAKSGAPNPKRAAAKSPAPKPAPKPPLSDPAYFPPTKAAGGFYAPLAPEQEGAPPHAAQQAPGRP